MFTTDTGMATVWLSRFVRMSGTRRLIGSYNLGSMANAMPMALGASALDRQRQVVAFCGDGGLSMLLGDLITAVSHDLPVKLVVFDNGRLGMVKLEMEQVGLPEFGTVLHNPDFAKVAEAIGMRGIRVERPDDVDAAVKEALATDGPGAARRAHQPRRDRDPADAHARAGLGLRDREDQGVRRQRGVSGYFARRVISRAETTVVPIGGTLARCTIANAMSSARVGRNGPRTGARARITARLRCSPGRGSARSPSMIEGRKATVVGIPSAATSRSVSPLTRL